MSLLPRCRLRLFSLFLGRVARLSAFASTSSLALALAACSSEDAGGPGHGTGARDEPGGSCNVVTKSESGLSQMHVAVCSSIEYLDTPPAGGPHYPSWAAFRSYSFPVPRGFWVHDLEHGAVVYSYNCEISPGDASCADEVAEVQALIDALPQDPACSGFPSARRVLLTPDPLLDVRWGVSAWGFSLRASCVDSERFRQFYLNHFALGPEDFCNPGIDFGDTPPCE